MVVLAGQPAGAQQADLGVINREYTIKAAYLYNFARYVTWPDGAFQGLDAPLVIGVLGEDPFGDALETIAQTKKIDSRAIVVRRYASLSEYEPCHVLFVVWNVGEETQDKALKELAGRGVLLVGETPTFTQRGGVIGFFVEENKIRFEINPAAAQRERLKISSKLLSLARLVGQAKHLTTRMADALGTEGRSAGAGAWAPGYPIW